MQIQLLTTVKEIAQRHYVRVMAFAVLGVLVGAVVVFSVVPRQIAEAPTTQETPVATSSGLYARSAPVLLTIPKVELSAEFEAPLGLNADNTVEVPDSYEKVGWYVHGATPGEIGPAVILGHVDSYKGPAVFYNLGTLEAGDEISVTRADGTIAVFVVEYLKRYDQEEFPTALVYGPIDYAGLRLITCSGWFDKAAQKYSHNLVVYAKLRTP